MPTLARQKYIVHPHKFNMWLFILTVIMIFGSMTSAYIVSRGNVKHLEYFSLPNILWINTIIIVFSSMTMQFAVRQVKKSQLKQATIFLGMTLALGIAFLAGQWGAFDELKNGGHYFVDPDRFDNSVTFFYVLTALHAVHIIGTVLALGVVFIQTLTDSFKPGKRILTYEITATLWHFLGLLWVYLFLFLMFTQTT